MSTPGDELNAALSAVMDGCASPAQWAMVNAAWAQDPGLRDRWAAWHVAGDGLRSSDLPALHRDPVTLLDALHARLPSAMAAPRRRRDWFAPFAVAAGFVAVAVGIGAWKPQPAPEGDLAAAPFTTWHAQGLSGMSFAQTAAGLTLPQAGLPTQAAPEIIDWGMTLPATAASHPAP